MMLKLILCFVCVHVISVVMVNGRSPPISHQKPRDASHLPRSGGAQNHHPGGYAHTPAINETLRADQRSVQECGLCPMSYDIDPCTCSCLNETAATLICGQELLSCTQLTEIMCKTSYPVNKYLRLVVQDTGLQCELGEELWGPLMFTEIIMVNNHFKTLDNRAFLPFSSTLRILNLDDNILENIFFPTMEDTPLLEVVVLSHNELQFLPGYYTMVLPLLHTFNASYNQIRHLQAKTFAGMPSLREIDLSHNAIVEVSANSFTIPDHHAANLTINLAHNLISSIEPGFLEGVRVCSLFLQDNRLTTLQENVFRPVIDYTAALSLFWTDDNPFDCDDHFCWIVLNETVSNTFTPVRCPNYNDEPLEVLSPGCVVIERGAESPHARVRPRLLPALVSPSFRKQKAHPAHTIHNHSTLKRS